MHNTMIKTADDIERIREGGAHLARIVRELVGKAIVGANTADIDDLAEDRMREIGAIPSFKGYKPRGIKTPFNSTICASINDEVVHAPAHPGRILKEGDIFSIDIGMVYKERYTDMAVTVGVGKISDRAQKLIDTTRRSLEEAIASVSAGKPVRVIGQTVEKVVHAEGFGVVEALVGHGVGYAVHEDPQVPNYDEPYIKTVLQEGMVLALEPMITEGTHEVIEAADGWTIKTADGKLAAHFEHTIVVTKDGCEILTI